MSDFRRLGWGQRRWRDLDSGSKEGVERASRETVRKGLANGTSFIEKRIETFKGAEYTLN